jgi:type II secretory pathway pseudopilin PulG
MAGKKHRPESGFALLLVFLMAAVIAISLYMEIPRVSFDSQRQKEQLLVFRGEQYKRAIQLYFRASKKNSPGRYPADLDDLERGFNNMRFLRHRYKDPMTGKDEWRLIHMQNGMLTDSVLTKNPNGQKQDSGGSSGAITAMAGISDLQASTQGQMINALTRRRPSEGGGGATVGPDGQPLQTGGTIPGAPSDPNAAPGVPQPGSTAGAPVPFQPGVPAPPSDPNAPGTSQPGLPGQQPGLPGQNPQFPTAMGGGMPGNMPGYPQPGMPVNPQQPSAASGMINNLLTSPRPGGMAGLNNPAQGGTVIGGGLVGVASKADADGIMVYNDRTNYGEWEFIYDITKDRPVTNPLSGSIGTPVGQMGTTPTPLQGTPGAPGTTNPNGTASGQGTQSLGSDSSLRPGQQ